MIVSQLLKLDDRDIADRANFLRNNPDCSGSRDCIDCYGCVDCSGCIRCDFCVRCMSCVSCRDCLDCHDCRFCIECSNLRDKMRCIGNRQFDVQTYQDALVLLGASPRT